MYIEPQEIDRKLSEYISALFIYLTYNHQRFIGQLSI